MTFLILALIALGIVGAGAWALVVLTDEPPSGDSTPDLPVYQFRERDQRQNERMVYRMPRERAEAADAFRRREQ